MSSKNDKLLKIFQPFFGHYLWPCEWKSHLPPFVYLKFLLDAHSLEFTFFTPNTFAKKT